MNDTLQSSVLLCVGIEVAFVAIALSLQPQVDILQVHVTTTSSHCSAATPSFVFFDLEGAFDIVHLITQTVQR